MVTQARALARGFDEDARRLSGHIQLAIGRELYARALVLVAKRRRATAAERIDAAGGISAAAGSVCRGGANDVFTAILHGQLTTLVERCRGHAATGN